MAENALQVERRGEVGKGVARKLRARGRIPGVVYGKQDATVPIALDARDLRRLLEKSEAGLNTLINLQAEGSELDGKVVLVRELQRDPVRGDYLHADLYTVDLERTVEVSVPVHLSGKARGVEFGGILDHALREVELECLPLSIPREIVVDVSELDVGDSLHVRDLPLPDGVALRSDPDLSVVSVVAPRIEEEAPAEAELPAAEVPEGEAAAPEGEERAEPSEESEGEGGD